MAKNYTRKFQYEILKTHVLFAFISIIIMVLFMTFMDRYYNGAFVDITASIIGWDFAHFLLQNKSTVISFVLLVVLLLNSLLVEMYAIRKISHVFSQMKILFQKDDQRIHLDKYLVELENDLNDLKFESMENEKKAIKEAQHKVDMIAYLAHDIKTPLASVIGYLCLLDEANDLTDEKRKEYTHITLEKAYRLESLINEFFDIAKINQSSSPLHKEEINLSYLLQQMKEEFFPILIQKDQEILLKVDEAIKIYADPNKIARVFNNILKNAFYYGNDHSAIHIESYEDNEYTHILFMNHGKTIPQDKIDMVFEQFYRLDESRSSSTGGSGLGLSIAKTIVEQHDGMIKLTSDNHMTTFEVTIPHHIEQIE
ncbi:MAG: HAMP domain-containing histidine kinase [Erysipelotrichaceae bacterium]|nr:HAMP domain-containing histidine kinase [Erysipelotrichaceae bacterium]